MHRTGKIIPLIVTFMLLMPLLVYGQSYFLDVPGIPGEVTEAAFMDEICITSFSWNVERTIGTTGGGSTVAVAGEFKFGKSFDRASPLLFGAVARGQSFPQLTFTVYLPAGSGPGGSSARTLAVYELRNVTFTGYQPGGEVPSIPKEVISLVAERVKISHFDDANRETTFTWDFQNNTGG